MADPDPWTGGWRGRWIWDREPDREGFWWNSTEAPSHWTYLRYRFDARAVMDAADVPEPLPARATCDSRYVLFLNGRQLGRGPIRSEPEFLGWDEYDLAPYLVPGANVLVALCHYYGQPGPWWVPARALGTLGRGSFCFETAARSPIGLVTGADWRAVPAPWVPNPWRTAHAFPPEVIDGRLTPPGLHDPAADESIWPHAVILAGHGHGTVLDRPPAAPYLTPMRRPIPQLTSERLAAGAALVAGRPVSVQMLENPVDAWATLTGRASGSRRVSVWDIGRLTLAHIRLEFRLPRRLGGAAIDVVAGEDLRADGLPEIRPRSWAARYIASDAPVQEVAFFDPVGLRFVAVHHPPGVQVRVGVEETIYPRPEGTEFTCEDSRYEALWRTGVRTVDVCSADALLDCPGREQRAWVLDAYPQILVSLVSNPDRRLVRHHLELTSRSKFPSGLLAGAAACDFAHAGLTTPEYSLHWIRSLAAYWLYSGDEDLIRAMLPTANAIIERYERQRGPSGLLEDFPGWVFIDWAQTERDVVTAVHDALYAAALADYSQLPGASDVTGLIGRTKDAFEQLWDQERHAYVDAIGRAGPGRRMSQHTNAMALVAGLVPAHRADRLLERIIDPAGSDCGGRLVITASAATVREQGTIPTFQYAVPERFNDESDVVAAQPWFCRFLHEALFRNGRVDLIRDSLLRWDTTGGNGTFGEFWSASPGCSSRCHGWSASPAFDLISYVLGVRPETPGFGQAVVDPRPGTLRRIRGRVPTPLGWLTVAIDGPQVEVDVPVGMTVRVGTERVSDGRHQISVAEARLAATLNRCVPAARHLRQCRFRSGNWLHPRPGRPPRWRHRPARRSGGADSGP